MLKCLLAPLVETLRPHFDLSKTRLETLAVLLVGLANGRTVNLSHLASQFPGDAQHGSNYRRLQRFFQFVQLDSDIAARLLVRMLNLERPTLLALDRINWKLGSRDVNVLVLAVVIVARSCHRSRLPIEAPLMGWMAPAPGSAMCHNGGHRDVPDERSHSWNSLPQSASTWPKPCFRFTG